MMCPFFKLTLFFTFYSKLFYIILESIYKFVDDGGKTSLLRKTGSRYFDLSQATPQIRYWEPDG